jgi:RNA-binding protein
MSPLTNPERRRLKAAAQHLEPILKIGRQGLSAEFVAALDRALADRELVKVKFVEFKDQKQTLAPQLAERTGSALIQRVGNVAVLYRRKPTPPAASS